MPKESPSGPPTEPEPSPFEGEHLYRVTKPIAVMLPNGQHGYGTGSLLVLAQEEAEQFADSIERVE